MMTIAGNTGLSACTPSAVCIHHCVNACKPPKPTLQKYYALLIGMLIHSAQFQPQQ
jgi:hypothetical protein